MGLAMEALQARLQARAEPIGALGGMGEGGSHRSTPRAQDPTRAGPKPSTYRDIEATVMRTRPAGRASFDTMQL